MLAWGQLAGHGAEQLVTQLVHHAGLMLSPWLPPSPLIPCLTLPQVAISSCILSLLGEIIQVVVRRMHGLGDWGSSTTGCLRSSAKSANQMLCCGAANHMSVSPA